MQVFHTTSRSGATGARTCFKRCGLAKVSVNLEGVEWFLDPRGREVFEKVGWSEKLLEEFSWRIEAICGDKPLRRP